jgi:hypothetical protein
MPNHTSHSSDCDIPPDCSLPVNGMLNLLIYLWLPPLLYGSKRIFCSGPIFTDKSKKQSTIVWPLASLALIYYVYYKTER